jgi:hypothetical protein
VTYIFFKGGIMKVSKVSALLLISFAASVAWAQDPSVDGVVQAGEYKFTQTKDGMSIGAKQSADGKTIYLSVSVQTAGWVSVGTGSAKMDKAIMVIGYVTGDTPTVLYQLGKGLSHSPTSPDGITAKVIEKAGVTTLEVSMPAGSHVKSGELDVLVAYSTKDEVKGRHTGRAALKAKL